MVEVLLGVEALHLDHGATDALRGPGEAERGGVVERRGGEVAGVGVEAEGQLAQQGDRIGITEREATEGSHDPLGATGGARGVQHVVAGVGVDRRGRLGVHRGGEVDPAGRELPGGGAQAEAAHQTGEGLGRQLGEVAVQVVVDHQGLGLAVVDDVLRLGRAEAAAHRGVDDPGPVGAPQQVEELRLVVELEGQVVAGLQAERAQQVGHLVGSTVQLGVGHLCSRPHDECRFVGGGGGDETRVHDGRSFSVFPAGRLSPA
jgi:hypothetical protein